MEHPGPAREVAFVDYGQQLVTRLQDLPPWSSVSGFVPTALERLAARQIIARDLSQYERIEIADPRHTDPCVCLRVPKHPARGLRAATPECSCAGIARKAASPHQCHH